MCVCCRVRLHLSHFLREVKNGEDVLVTDRGKAIAQIVPVKAEESQEDIRSILIQMAKKGGIVLPQQWGKPVNLPRRVKVKGAPFSDAIIENRR